ncbi:hypothetical protein N0V87_002135 [Didymella glomerata]|uniref:BTB domain-containing protein n=1 Tax=Didymella glomerata TaxID=749621 RepID=A0A9W8X4U0_9PLEO|nr:hypothetical protein N0V87_002135 [Didymella glomerata]
MPPTPRVTVRKEHGFRLGRQVTTIQVGPKKQLFAIHEDLLCKYSTFFRDTLRPNRLPEIHRFDQITERSFELYIEWLYTGQITVTPMPTERGTVPWTLAIVDAYALGTVIGDPAFCYALMRSLIEIVIEYHTYPGVRAEFHSDLALAMIRRPAADVKTWTVEGLSRYLPERPPNAV